MTFKLCRIAPWLTVFLSLCTTAWPQSCAVAPPGLVSWWTGDNDENDVLGGNNPQAVAAVTVVPGEVRNGLTFGTNGYIEIPSASNLANQHFTWTAWVRPDGPGPNNDNYGSVIVEQAIDGNHAVRIEESLLALKDDGQIGLAVAKGVVGSAVGERIAALFGRHHDGLAHALSD